MRIRYTIGSGEPEREIEKPPMDFAGEEDGGGADSGHAPREEAGDEGLRDR